MACFRVHSHCQLHCRGYKQGKGAHNSGSDGTAGTLAAADHQRSQQPSDSRGDSNFSYQHADAHDVQWRRPQPPQQMQPRPEQQHGASLHSSHDAVGTVVQPPQSSNAGSMQQARSVAAGPASAPVIMSASPALPAGTQLPGSNTNDPLHDSHVQLEKEAEQLTALSKVVQQQQDTISRQVRQMAVI